MHPFCCVSAIPDNASVKPSPSAGFVMPTLPTAAASPRSDPITRPANDSHNNHSHGHVSQCITNGGDSGRSIHREIAPPAATAASAAAAALEVKIKDLVGSGISGILYKWVNYGKGWRPRWFVLRDGVLSYYKIHGPDRIVVNSETEKRSRVIGEESMRRIARSRNSHHSHHHHHHQQQQQQQQQLQYHRRKPLGEIHLKVSLSVLLCLLILF